MNTVIGTCSCCGGPVTVPTIWFGVIPPTPTCASCGARMARLGPVVPMVPPGLRDGQTYVIGAGTSAHGSSIADMLRAEHGGGSGG